jgi:two-component system, chemotaxis family, protein-glutamate methylesterase/glutaminase
MSQIAASVIVIGASTGGIHALKTIISGLPAELPAAVLVVLHRSESSPDHLTEILQAVSALPISPALHGERLEPGRVYLAPPDNHLLVRSAHVEVVRGPRENASRPAVNPLFRTAAAAHGSRVIGVVLTGHLDCGTAGMQAIKAYGGTNIAQEPASAECGEMPASAIRSGAVDEVLPLDSIAPRLIELVQQGREASESAAQDQLPMAYSFNTCPHCHGSLSEKGGPNNPEFECHVGHRFSLRSLYAEQAEEVETALWAAMRSLEEGAAVAKRLADTAQGSLKERFTEREGAMRSHARTIQEILLSRATSTPMDIVGSGWEAQGD